LKRQAFIAPAFSATAAIGAECGGLGHFDAARPTCDIAFAENLSFNLG
jgi:hypothetical protein